MSRIMDHVMCQSALSPYRQVSTNHSLLSPHKDMVFSTQGSKPFYTSAFALFKEEIYKSYQHPYTLAAHIKLTTLFLPTIGGSVDWS